MIHCVVHSQIVVIYPYVVKLHVYQEVIFNFATSQVIEFLLYLRKYVGFNAYNICLCCKHKPQHNINRIL